LTYKLTIAYDGTAFHGSQAQAADKGRTVQGTVEAALAHLTGSPVRSALAGRTDAGVHARGQVASCELPKPWPPADLRRALNAVLPPDVAVRAVEVVPEGFHARFDATARAYRYLVWNAPVADPLWRHVTWHVRDRLDLAAMQAAALPLVGTHDFAAFCGAGRGVPPADEDGERFNTVRTLTTVALQALPPTSDWWAAGGDADAAEADERLVALDVIGNAFLPHMIRTIIGTLVEVGQGRRPFEDINRLLAGRDRRLAAATAPPPGLCLVRVWYEE
jgi:tRNA pseudouridine38-40 synthase